MGIKKIARPINKAKNDFLKYLKDNNAEDIEVWECKPLNDPNISDFDYYRGVSGFIGDNLITVYFTMWESKIKISYSDDENNYNDMPLIEFTQMFK